MLGYDYPDAPIARRHGPFGYHDYESFRDWLRDEFAFRCVYCLNRERWSDRRAAFHIDHLVPVSSNSSGALEYDNLVYACMRCNNAKRAQVNVPNPCAVGFARCIEVQADGRIRCLSAAGRQLVMKLQLNSSSAIEWRRVWLQVLETLQTSKPDLYAELMAYPVDLPDLRSKRVVGNNRPEGVDNCYFERRKRGELAATY